MALNPSIIMSGQQPDIVNALDRGNVAGQRNIEFGRQNALNSLYQAQGPQIAQGEQSALNALSRFDPMASLGVQDARLGQDQTRLGMDATRLGMDATRQNMSQNDQKMTMALEQHAASLSAAEREQQRMDIENDLAVLMTAQTPQQWDQMAEQTGNPNMVGQFDNREAAIAPFIGLKEVLERQATQNAPADAQSPLAKLRQDFDNGLIDAATYQAAVQKATAQDGMALEVGADGTVRFNQGAGAGQEDGRMSPSDPQAMISSIDSILNDPALENSTGFLSALQAVPGTPQYRFGTKARQLEGQAFLQAFESLKGAGQITEIEGLKATQAVGRLDTAQSAADYRDALTELKGVLEAATARPPGWAAQQASQDETLPPAPQGFTQGDWQALWENMAPEDRALFQ